MSQSATPHTDRAVKQMQPAITASVERAQRLIQAAASVVRRHVEAKSQDVLARGVGRVLPRPMSYRVDPVARFGLN